MPGCIFREGRSAVLERVLLQIDSGEVFQGAHTILAQVEPTESLFQLAAVLFLHLFGLVFTGIQGYRERFAFQF